MSQTVRARSRPHHPTHHFMPWRDRSGRFSPLKAAALLLAVLPGAWLAASWGAGTLGPRPVTEVIHGTGLWAVRFLLLSLLVSPLRTLLNWQRVVLLRRLLGVTALAYAAAHLVLYADDQGWKMLTVVLEIARRFYLTIGFVSLLGLAVLGVTSTEGWMRRLGRSWKKLHRTVYVLAALGVFHFFLQAKADVSEAATMAGLLIWLIGWRLLPAGPDRAPLPMLGLAAAATLATAGLEYAWYGLATRIPPLRPVLAELTVGPFGLHPAGQVLVATLCLALATALGWAHRRARLKEAAAFHVALYVSAAAMAGALGYAFGLGGESDAPPWVAPAIWVGLLALLGIARWRLPADRRLQLDILVPACLAGLLAIAGAGDQHFSYAAGALLILAALAAAARAWPVSRTSALLLLPLAAWVCYAAAPVN